jgi:hypothetical protein
MFGRDDTEDIERSRGSPSNQLVRFSGSFDPSLMWKLGLFILVIHPWCYAGKDSMSTRKYGMVMVDLEAGGKEVGRFLGHGASVIKITTGVALQDGQGGHVFCTGCSDATLLSKKSY